MAIAVFGAGCFWGVEVAFGKVKGVTATSVGYTGGNTDNPTYEQVCTGNTGHAEVVWVEFDPSAVSYEELLDVFWGCLLYTSPSPRDLSTSRMPSSA